MDQMAGEADLFEQPSTLAEVSPGPSRNMKMESRTPDADIDLFPILLADPSGQENDCHDN